MSAFGTGVGLSLVAAVAIAVQSLSVRHGTREHSVSAVIALVFLVNLVVLVPLAAVPALQGPPVSTRAIAAFAIAGVLGSLLARWAYFEGIDRLGSSRAEPLKALLPIFALIAAVLTLGETVTLPQLGGITVLVAGGVVVSIDARASPLGRTGRALLVDLSFPVAAALFLGVDPIFTKVGLAEGVAPIVGVTIRILAAAGGFAVYLTWRQPALPPVRRLLRNRALVAAGVANTAYLISFYAALDRIPVTVVTPITGVSTVLVVAGAAVFLQRDERVTWRLGLAALLAVAGVVLVVTG
jgi:drug/metabolite transporter (DMT)-like permease